jgi:tripartite-type tricarboxylate transporter receptor subunit TctC
MTTIGTGGPSLLARCMLALALAAPCFAQAQSYPARQVRYIVPFPPAGATDIMARNVAQVLSESWNQPVVVENRPGGNALIGADVAAKSPADGYTYLAITLTHAINATLFPKAPFDLRRDFTVVSVLSSSPMLVVVNASSPVKTLADLTALARSKNLSAGSSGNGSPPHMGLEQYRQTAGFAVTHVPYKGGAPSLTDLVGGQLDFIVSNLPESIGHVKGGRLRPLALTSRNRHPLVPEVPTTVEAGTPGLSITNWTALVVPAGTPADIVSKIHADVAKGLKQPQMTRRIQEQGFEVIGSAPAEAQAFVAAEVERWSKVVRDAGIKSD